MNEEKDQSTHIKIPAHFSNNAKIYASFALILIGAVLFEVNLNAIGASVDSIALVLSIWFLGQKIKENDAW